MNEQNTLPVWCLGAIPAEVCDLAMADYMRLESMDAAMGDAIKDTSRRSTTVRFPANDHWFGGVLYAHGMLANKSCNWGFDVQWHESVQLAEYGPTQHYEWHADASPLRASNHDRKISISCQMNDPAEYEGGELQFRFHGVHIPQMKKGSIIAFPSFVEHRVSPVTLGKRYSSVLWMNGPRAR